MQNQTNHLSAPVVRRSRVTPKDILDNVEAKQDIDAAAEMPTAITGRFSCGMSEVRLPKPKVWPTWVKMASPRRKTLSVLVGFACMCKEGSAYP